MTRLRARLIAIQNEPEQYQPLSEGVYKVGCDTQSIGLHHLKLLSLGAEADGLMLLDILFK